MNKIILNDIIEIISGGTPKTNEPEYWDNGTIGWLSINDFNNDRRKVYHSEKLITKKGLEKSNAKLLQVDDIIISARGTVGVLAQIGKPMAFNQSCFGLRGRKGLVDNTYLYYALKNYVGNIQKRGQGSVFNTINLDSFKLMEISIENDIIAQEKIAAILSTLDDKIELNNKINAELEAMAKTLYDYWFVQFDFLDAKGKPYKSSGGKMFYNEELKREIPEGWEVKFIGDLLVTSLGGTPSTKVDKFWNGNINWLNSGEIANFPIMDSELKITKEAIKNSATYLLPKGSVLISITRHLRPSVLAIDACANQSVVGIKEKDEIRYYFLYPYLKNEIPRLMTRRTGAQQPHINKQIVDESLIVIPNKESNILEKYNLTVGCFYESIFNNAFQNKELSTLRDWLLPMLMNGQVSVGESYEKVEEVLNVAAENIASYKKQK